MDQTILLFIAVGFAAQMIDGALGMAYGVSSTTFLLSMGIPPAAASASVHTSEVSTTFVSGLSHFKFGNVDVGMLKRLLIPGVIGGVIGAYILTSVDGNVIKPFISAYLVIMGIVILRKALKRHPHDAGKKIFAPLGLIGGFFDAIGGGGWGPIVTSTLLANGHHPRFAIGSVNAAEFFVTVAQAVTFFAILGLVHWQIIVGLIIGGVLAAPFAAYTCKKLPSRLLMVLVGVLFIGLSLRTIYLTLV